MGFFSSITKPLKKAVSWVGDAVGKVGNFLSDNSSSLLGMAGDLAGGFLGLSGTKDANQASAELAAAQMAAQKELAQNQIQWRVEDAKKANIHPLAALGVSSASYSPVSANFSAPDYSFLSDMGQNLNRAIMQGKTKRERAQAQARQDELDVLALRKARADVDYAETIAASERYRLQRELFPPSPAANQSRDTQLPSPAFQKFVLPDGTVTGWYPSDEYQQIHEDIPVLEFMPHARANWWHLKDWMKKKDTHKGYYLPRSWR